ncbi:hypothetical protein GCM10023205_82110 [Yinghuangia aomiensis]|uniref:Phosphotransferase enzyme family protein n=1 Tax=Yinghuangia aomiensis TaxID=676205 RepID=A0ABP9IF28_9ACTN
MEPELLSLITPHTGTVREITPVNAGYRGGVKATVRGARGMFFVKAWSDEPGARDPREVALNPYIKRIGPELVAYERRTGWMALVYEHVDGSHSNLSPGSPDVQPAVSVVASLGGITVPDHQDWPHRTWKDLATLDEAALLDGNALLHSDINPDNILVGDGEARIVDWGSPTLGAPVVNLAELVTQLIAAGHDPAAAEEAVSGCSVWGEADTETLDTVAAVLLRMHRKWELERPRWTERFPPGTWLRSISPAVGRWAAYRGVGAE